MITRLVPLGIGVTAVCTAIVVFAVTRERPATESAPNDAPIDEPVVADAKSSAPSIDPTTAITPSEPTASVDDAPPEDSSRKPAASRGATKSGECADVRRRAESARERYQWRELLRLVGARECFKAEERQRLRTKAYMELGQFDRCTSTGEDAADPEVRRWAQLCKRRRG